MTGRYIVERKQTQPATVYETDTPEDLAFLARDARGWATIYANAGRHDAARIEREAAESFEREIRRRESARA
jgi:hypothetical protein